MLINLARIITKPRFHSQRLVHSSSFIHPFIRFYVSQLTSLLVPRDTNLKGETMTREAIHLRGKERA